MDNQSTDVVITQTDEIERECRSIATQIVLEEINEQLDDPNDIEVGRTRIEDDDAIYVSRLFVGSNTPSEHEIGFDELRQVTPRRVELTLENGGSEHTCQISVYVYDSMIVPD